MDSMNPLLANIYQTHGGPDMHKVASEGGDPSQLPESLSDLAMMIASSEGVDLEKTAAAHGNVLQDLIELDQAGRMMAQAEFSDMEKQASEGDFSALESFFADVGQASDEQRAQLRHAVASELQRRGLR